MTVRDEVGFFQAVRASLAKAQPEREKSPEEINAAIRQIVSKSVLSGDVVDIFQEAGLQKPDISVLSDEFLAEVQGMCLAFPGIGVSRRLVR
jgi:type I restriction enzyme R subunit